MELLYLVAELTPTPGLKHKIVIVEDEPLYSMQLEDLLLDLGHDCLGVFTNAQDALIFLAKGTYPDLFLMDINIEGDMDGVDLAAEIMLENPRPIIFITSNYDDESYERAKATAPAAFLEKTFRKRQLTRAIDLAIANLNKKNQEAANQSKLKATSSAIKDTVFVKKDHSFHKIHIEDIFYIEAEDHYCTIYLKGERHVIRQSLNQLLEELPSELFFKTHRSVAVNLKKVDSINAHEQTVAVGEYQVALSRGQKEVLLGLLEKW